MKPYQQKLLFARTVQIIRNNIHDLRVIGLMNQEMYQVFIDKLSEILKKFEEVPAQSDEFVKIWESIAELKLEIRKTIQ